METENTTAPAPAQPSAYLHDYREKRKRAALVALACSNLEALAEQAEALENTPLAVRRSPRRRAAPAAAVRRMEVLSLLQ